jgi:hypothetical protein
VRALLLLATCTAVAAGVARAGTPRPGIGIDWRIGAVHFDELKSDVDAAVGPGQVKRLDRYNGKWIFYRRARIYVSYVLDRGHKYAFAVVTKSARYRTRSDIGVGSTLRTLRRGLKVSCDLVDYYTCQTAPANRDHPFTLFQIDRVTKRVTEVQILPGGD